MEACGLEILDVENLRRNYALTLDAWTERFDANWEEINKLDPVRFDDRFRRIWRTYLVSCAEMFRSPHGTTYLFQILYSKGNVNQENFPMSRRYIYQQET
jgi:cyclopropane-fatty-acyl-phospholipid synthase